MEYVHLNFYLIIAFDDGLQKKIIESLGIWKGSKGFPSMLLGERFAQMLLDAQRQRHSKEFSIYFVCPVISVEIRLRFASRKIQLFML